MSNPYFRNSLVIVCAVFLVAAAGRSRLATDGREPLVITASSMEAEKLGERITFTGGVSLKKEGMTLSSDSMIVHYDIQARSIREIEAHGNVVMRREGRVALSRDATYYSAEEKIIMTGDARIIENQNQIGGGRITLFMRDDRSIVESGKVTIYEGLQPPAEKKRK